MRTSSAAALLAVASLATAAPLAKRQQNDIDATILNYALTLEHLEATFYAEGLSKYDASAFENAGYPDWVRKRVSEIGSHEATHVTFLTTALKAAGANATAACSYKFPDTDPKSFLAVAQILEGVGVSAYLGAAQNITNPSYLTAAGSILTVEARHNAWIRSAVNKGDAFPEPFDTPLDFNQVYSLAAPFITSCPSSNPPLPVKAFPALTLKTTGKLSSGEEITFSYSGMAAGQFVAFIHETSQVVESIGSDGKVKIPDSVHGQVYAVVIKSNETVSDDITIAGPAVVEVDISPSMTFSTSS